MEDLLEKLMNAIDAKIEHDKQRDGYDGYEWGYHGRREIEAMDQAGDALKDALKDAIREVIAEQSS